jgi:hypothetical protein
MRKLLTLGACMACTACAPTMVVSAKQALCATPDSVVSALAIKAAAAARKMQP